MVLLFAHCNAWAADYAVSSNMRAKNTTVVTGIVEENNPQMGYISLYGEDGTGTSVGAEQFYNLRIYNYGNQNELEVIKNQKKASI